MKNKKEIAVATGITSLALTEEKILAEKIVAILIKALALMIGQDANVKTSAVIINGLVNVDLVTRKNVALK